MKLTEIERAEHRKRIKELETQVRRLVAQSRGDWQSAPIDRGIRGGGIRDRAIRIVNRTTREG
jgi:hypothetical protein